MEKADKKFEGDVFKVKDGTLVTPDQWVIFLFKDTAFADYALPAYVRGCEELGCDKKQIAMVHQLLDRCNRWRVANPGRIKIPDAEGEGVLE